MSFWDSAGNFLTGGATGWATQASKGNSQPKQYMEEVPILGGFLGGLFGGKSSSQEAYLKGLEEAKQQIAGYRPVAREAQNESISRQLAAMGPWRQVLAGATGGKISATPLSYSQDPVSKAEATYGWGQGLDQAMRDKIASKAKQTGYSPEDILKASQEQWSKGPQYAGVLFTPGGWGG